MSKTTELFSYAGADPAWNQNGNYNYYVRRLNWDTETWPVLSQGAGTSTSSGYVECNIAVNEVLGKFVQMSLSDIVFDLRKYSFLAGNITSARLRLWSNQSSSSYSGTGIFSTDTKNGITIGQQDETSRGIAPAASNYDEIYDGSYGGTELGTAVSKTTLAALGRTEEFYLNFNATGITYLNSTWTKANLPGYALIAIVPKGYIDGDTPTVPSGTDTYQAHGISGFYYRAFEVTFDDSVMINIGDTWEHVLGAQVNVNGSDWSPVLASQINIADVWKDQA